MKTTTITLRINPKIKQKAQRLADRENRSLSNYIEQLVNQAVTDANKRKR